MAKFLDYLKEANEDKTHVITFMRANPPTIGHERVVNQVKQLATDLGGDHTVVLSHSHDGQKNPLTAEQKLRHAKRAFPNTNIKTSSPESPSILHIASDLHKKGVNNLHVVVGQDRLKQFNDLLHKYNGYEGPHGFFNFKNIEVHSAGDRDPDAEGIEGVSGTSQRKHALTGNRDSFHLGAPSAMAPEHKDELMQDIINGTDLTPPPPKKTKKPKQEFNPGTPVYIQHGSHSQEPVKENTRISFRSLFEAKKKISGLENLLTHGDYIDARANTVNHLESVNDHISKGDSNDVHDKLSKYYNLVKNPHNKHFDNYSAESYPINMALYLHHNEGGDPKQLPDEDINGIDNNDIKGLDKALKFKKTPKPMTVFSGVGFNPGQLAAKHPKGNLYMPAYTSTSISPRVASNFAKPLTAGSDEQMYNPDSDKKKVGADHHMLRINLPKGHPGSYIADSSYYPEEKEFLLPRQQTMKINPNPEIHEFEHDGVTHRMHIWDATPVPTKLPKPLKEETVSADARGLGFATGNPAVNPTNLANYVAQNTADSDNKNNNLFWHLKANGKEHNIVGFSSFHANRRSNANMNRKPHDKDKKGE